MATITAPRRPHNQPHAGMWRRATHALGKLWATMITLPEAPAGATRRRALPSEYYNFPPY
jgi:hypothetical protein